MDDASTTAVATAPVRTNRLARSAGVVGYAALLVVITAAGVRTPRWTVTVAFVVGSIGLAGVVATRWRRQREQGRTHPAVPWNTLPGWRRRAFVVLTVYLGAVVAGLVWLSTRARFAATPSTQAVPLIVAVDLCVLLVFVRHVVVRTTVPARVGRAPSRRRQGGALVVVLLAFPCIVVPIGVDAGLMNSPMGSPAAFGIAGAVSLAGTAAFDALRRRRYRRAQAASASAPGPSS